ncbi:MAG: hypothetical protein EPO13_12060 [Actinomycetota bacterium]|nr:MAG: hypothetical protein EPO13_12060 [Actinomycetota bacterium]
MKARRPDAVTALRTAIAAIDNAAAVDPTVETPGAAGDHVAGARTGVGSTEAARRRLGSDELHAILRDQITERLSEADRYDSLGRVEDAQRLRREADVLSAYLS